MRETWRLLIDDAADGPTNMARDEALLNACAAADAPPTLRIYRWRPATLSLGRFQRAGEIDWAACERGGVAIVRRPSGGRALLHEAEVTYALAARSEHPLLGGASILDSYRRISAALLAGLRRLGVAAELAPPRSERRGAARHASAACFDAPAGYELTAGGRKLAGSAQARREGALLQHGAILLAPHAGRLAGLLAAPPDDLAGRMAALSELLGREVGFGEVAEALIDGFRAHWQVDLAPGAWSAAELEDAAGLRAAKYADDGWTFGR